MYDFIGLTLLFFLAAWGIYAAYLLIRQPGRRLEGGVLGTVALLLASGFLFLTASTSARRAFINLEMRQLTTMVALVFLSLLAAILLAAATWWIAERINGNRTTGWRFYFVASTVMVIIVTGVSWWLYQETFAPDLDEVYVAPTHVRATAWLEEIPTTVYDDTHVTSPTALEVGPQNELYVASNDGKIWTFIDDNMDGLPDQAIVFADGLKKPQGIAWYEGALFVNVEGSLLRLVDADGDYRADETTTIKDGFPRETYAFHRNHGIVVGDDGRLYIGVGSTSDADPEVHPLGARVVSMLPDGSDMRDFATGLRNPYGIVREPGGDGFFAVENGPSACVTNGCVIKRADVPEEINYLREGNDYGFPYYFGVPPQDSGTMPPMATLFEHSAPTGIVIYDGDALPPATKGQLFFSMWARGEIWRTALYKIDEDHYATSPTFFASGIQGPSALINSPYGGLFVTAYSANAIYHIGALPGK